MNALADRIGVALAVRGARRGTVVALGLSPSPHLVASILGAWRAGAAITVLPERGPRLDGLVYSAEIERRLGFLGADVVLVDEEFEGGETLIAAGGTRVEGLLAPTSHESTLLMPSDPTSTAIVQFTSGSTGEPSAVAVSHRALRSNLEAMAERYRLGPADVIGTWLPMSHDMGLIGCVCQAIHLQSTLVLCHPRRFIADPMKWAQTMTEERVTFWPAPNFAYRVMSRLRPSAEHGLDLGALRAAPNGGEPVSAVDVKRFIRVFSPWGLGPNVVLPAYGLAEATLAVAVAGTGDGMKVDEVDRAGLERNLAYAPGQGEGVGLVVSGHPVSGVSLRIVNNRGEQASAREVGEIEVSGASLAQPVGPDGLPGVSPVWLATGDLGYQLPTGELVVCGRTKDLLVVSGRNIQPQDVESAVGSVAGVRAGCVAAFQLGEMDGHEVVIAFEATDQADGRSDVSQLRSDVRDACLATAGVSPRHLAVLSRGQVPKTTSGKIRRAEARRRWIAEWRHQAAP
jgi:fatty-acyl-CoA synthase